jgi:regulator of nonsense transcripts 1
MLLGNELEISLKNHPTYPNWTSKGTVVRVLNNDEVCLDIHSNENPPPVNTGYQIEFIWRSTTFKRM